jgi:two-component system KDP operon response regulator KdpE
MTSGVRSLRILVIDDDPALRRYLRSGLTAQNYVVEESDLAAASIQAARHGTADLIVLDLGLPDMEGLDAIHKIREMGAMVPIVVLSSRDTEGVKVRALDLGADDYVTKPFGMSEFLARIRAALRHRLQQVGERAVFRAGDLTVDLVRRLVMVRGERIQLSPREYDLLRLLVTHAGKVLTHQFILRAVWGGETNVQYLRIYVRSLRQKIEPDPEHPRYLTTETGVGYRLLAPD